MQLSATLDDFMSHFAFHHQNVSCFNDRNAQKVSQWTWSNLTWNQRTYAMMTVEPLLGHCLAVLCFFTICFAEANMHRVIYPSPSRPWVAVPNMSLCLSSSTADFTASSIFHFLLERSLSVADRLIYLLALSRSMMAYLASVTLYSSTKDVKGSWNFEPVLYSPKLLGQPSTFSHLLRSTEWLLGSFSWFRSIKLKLIWTMDIFVLLKLVL